MFIADEERFFAVADGFENSETKLIGVKIMIESMLEWQQDSSNLLIKFEDIVGSDAKYNAQRILEVFSGKEGALLEIISLNVAASLIVMDRFDNLEDSYQFSKKYIISGKTFDYYNSIKK